MVAFLRELTDTDWHPLRVTGVVTALKNMDAKTVKAANGAAGSTHAPVAQITIGGSGVVIAGTWNLSGAIVTSAGKRIQHGGGSANDYLRLGAGHPVTSRSLTTPASPSAPDGFLYAYASAGNNFATTSRFRGTRVMFPLSPHDRSTLESARMRFSIRSSHANLPSMPKFRIVRVDMNGNAVALHTSRSGNYKDDGFLDISTATTGATYYAAGAEQWSPTYSTNQNNVVDLSKYAYFADFVEESGDNAFTPNVTLANGAGTLVYRFEMTCSGISTMAPQ